MPNVTHIMVISATISISLIYFFSCLFNFHFLYVSSFFDRPRDINMYMCRPSFPCIYELIFIEITFKIPELNLVTIYSTS